MARQIRKKYSPQQKLKIIKEGSLPNVRVADLCRHYDIYPTDYYRWKKQAECSMIEGLQPKKKKEKPLNRREQALEQENERLKAVIVQLTQEHLELKKKVLLARWAQPVSIGARPALPSTPNQKWHTDLMQLKIDGELYYYQGIIDAYSRYIIAWDIHAEGTALNTSLVLQEAYDSSPRGINPVVIADNGPEFIGKEFREVIKIHQGKDVRIAAYHPQSNGIDERFHRTLREEGLAYYGNLIEAKQQVGKWIEYYNQVRLHSAIDYMPPAIWHNGDPNILAEERKQKVLKAKQEREYENLRLAS
jgi:putative transposase